MITWPFIFGFCVFAAGAGLFAGKRLGEGRVEGFVRVCGLAAVMLGLPVILATYASELVRMPHGRMNYIEVVGFVFLVPIYFRTRKVYDQRWGKKEDREPTKSQHPQL